MEAAAAGGDVIRIIRIEKNLPKKKGFVPNSAANLIFHKQSKIVFMSSKLGYINWIRVRSRKEMQRSNRVYVLQTNLGRSWSHSSRLYEDSRHFISKEDKKPAYQTFDKENNFRYATQVFFKVLISFENLHESLFRCRLSVNGKKSDIPLIGDFPVFLFERTTSSVAIFSILDVLHEKNR